MKKLNIVSSEVKYKYYPKWEDFIKNNKKLIDDHVEIKIKESLRNIKDTKQRDKIYNNWMRDYKNELTNIWQTMKKRQ